MHLSVFVGFTSFLKEYFGSFEHLKWLCDQQIESYTHTHIQILYLSDSEFWEISAEKI